MVIALTVKRLLGVSLSLFCAALVQGKKECSVTKEPGIKTIDLRLPETRVPNQRTFYVCQHFEIPLDKEYHAVAFKPLIANHVVMHHMILFGCRHKIENKEPHRCGSDENRCLDWLTMWSLGHQGQVCTHNNTGVKFGPGGIQHLYLQIHWNNEALKGDLVDNSGMRIYYTEKLRKYDVGNVQIGQLNLNIPPEVNSHVESGGCSGECTRYLMKHSVYLTRTVLHMHHLGVGGALELYRGGRKVTTIAEEKPYDYATSPPYDHATPVEVLPGDDMRMSCWFDTATGDRHRNTSIYYGEGSDAEMCFAFVSYFPFVPDMPQCAQFSEFDTCKDRMGPVGGCDIREFDRDARSQLLPDARATCKRARENIMCSPTCTRALNAIFKHKCMQKSLQEYSQRTILSNLKNWEFVRGAQDACMESENV